jgi:cytosine permease
VTQDTHGKSPEHSSLIGALSRVGSEDFSGERIPNKLRLRWPMLTVVWFGAAMFVGLYYTGMEMGTQMGSLTNALTAIGLGAAFLCIFLILTGIVGQRTGASTALIGIYAFGRKGAAIPAFHIADIGWFIVMIAQFVVIVEYFVPWVDGRVLAALCSMLFLTNGFVGVKQMARLNLIALPILAFVGVYSIFRVGAVADGGIAGLFSHSGEATMTVTAGITVVVGTWISGASRAADYFRWARSTGDVVKSSILGFTLGFLLCIIAGALWGAALGYQGIPEILIALGAGMVPLGLLMFSFQTWTTNEHSGYVTSNSLPVFFETLTGKTVPRRYINIGIAFISMLVAGLGVENYFIPFISFLGVFIPVIGAISLTDYFIMSKTKFHWSGQRGYYSLELTDERVQRNLMNWAVLPALIIGFVIGFFLDWGVASVNAILGTAIAYVLSCLILAPINRKRVASHAN